MKYKLIAPIQGDLFSSKTELRSERDGISYELLLNEGRQISRMAISTIVPKEKLEKFRNAIEPGSGRVKLELKIGGDRELYDFLLAKLRAFEVELAFSTHGSFWRIDWTKIESQFIAENQQDEELAVIAGFRSKTEYRPIPTKVTPSGLKAIVNLIDERSPLYVAKGFWQEGMNFFRTFNYVQAFYSFFFILEDFFAEGKSGKAEVIKRLDRSKGFCDAAEYAFNALQNEERHKANLQRFFSEEQLEFNKENLPAFLFLMRGRMHHYSSKNRKKQATPYSQKEFESISFLTIPTLVAAKKSFIGLSCISPSSINLLKAC